MSKLLINEPPLLVLPSLAIAIGLNEAITLQQIHYWLDPRINKNFQEGKFWVYNSYEEWQKQFPFWSIRTIRRNIQSLEEKNLLISKNFSTNSFDKTKWYSINYIALDNYTPNKITYGQNDQIDTSISCASINPNLKPTIRPDCPKDEDNLTSSYIDTKNTTKITTENSLSHNKTNFSKNGERERKMIKIWNDIIEKELGREVNYTSSRGKLLNKRLEEFFNDNISKWNEFCQKIVKSKFLMGEKTDFRVQLDWVLEEGNLVKILEGTYNREEKGNTTKSGLLSIQELTETIEKSETPEFWKQMMITLMNDKGINTFNSWFKQNQYDSFKDGILQIKAPSKFCANWQIDNFFDDIVKACKKTIIDFKEVRIVY